MRGIDGSVILDLGDGKNTTITKPLTSLPISTLNENDTEYNLYPTLLNEPPIITQGIQDASIPKIRPIQAVQPNIGSLYINADGTVRVALGNTVTLRINAEQPSVLNVENGVPKIIETQQRLTYVWRKDNNVISTQDPLPDEPGFIVNGNQLIIQNPDLTFSGLYSCDVLNDIGATSSEDVELEIVDVENEPLFRLNHVVNPIGRNGMDSWTNTVGQIQTRGFSNIPNEEFKQTNKPDLFGYTTEMLNPDPLDLYYGYVSNYNPYTLLTNANYFTRSNIDYFINGEVAIASCYQDIDLTDLQEYIQGSVYGVTGVTGVFTCYIGNAVSRFLHNKNFINPTTRRRKSKYKPGQPRLGLDNMRIAGLPEINETVEVIIEQYDKETLIPSRYKIENGSIVRGPRITLLDPWRKALNAIDTNNLFQKVDTAASRLFGSTANTRSDSRYTLGQFIQHNKVVIDPINFNTTKIRIRLNFRINDSRLVEDDTRFTENTSEIYDINSWQQPYEPSQSGGIVVVPDSEYITSRESSRLRNQNRPISAFIPKNGMSRGLVTGLNFNVVPRFRGESNENTVNDIGSLISTRPVQVFTTFPSDDLPQERGIFSQSSRA